MSNLAQQFKNSASAVTLALAAAFTTGCASTALPTYNSVDAGTRTANTAVTPEGIRYHANGAPVQVHYNACRDLNQATRQLNNNRTVQRSIDNATRTAGRQLSNTRKNFDLGDVLRGAGATIGAAIAGNEANKAIQSPHIKRLEADCNQQRAYETWHRSQNGGRLPVYGR